MNTNPHFTYHAQNDDIDVWCRYKFVRTELDDGKIMYDTEWVGELEVTFAEGKLIRLTKQETKLLVDSLAKMFGKQIDHHIETRIKQLEEELDSEESK